jgi:hypothetical protein
MMEITLFSWPVFRGETFSPDNSRHYMGLVGKER